MFRAIFDAGVGFTHVRFEEVLSLASRLPLQRLTNLRVRTLSSQWSDCTSFELLYRHVSWFDIEQAEKKIVSFPGSSLPDSVSTANKPGELLTTIYISAVEL